MVKVKFEGTLYLNTKLDGLFIIFLIKTDPILLDNFKLDGSKYTKNTK